MPENPGDCDAACVKIIIDTGMGIFAADLYRNSLIRAGNAPSPVDYEAPKFYSDVVRSITGVAQQLNTHKPKLTKDQHDRLMAQVNKECYRSDDLIEWARGIDTATAADIRDHTDEIFSWAKDDQTFYTALNAELGKL